MTKFLFKGKRKKISFLKRGVNGTARHFICQENKNRKTENREELVTIFLITIRIMTKSCVVLKKIAHKKQDLTEKGAVGMDMYMEAKYTKLFISK